MEKIGEVIVDYIIKQYRASDDFKLDAIHYIYKYVYDCYNSQMAEFGEYFKETSFKEDGILKEDIKTEFITKFSILRNELHNFMELYQKVFQYAPKYKELINKKIFNEQQIKTHPWD